MVSGQVLIICSVLLPLLTINSSNYASAFVPSQFNSRSGPSALSMASSVNQVQNNWKWKGQSIFTEVTSDRSSQGLGLSLPFFGDGIKKPAILLIHGFGCSTVYWRATKQALVDVGYEVHALDLLGQGKSSKPGRADGIEYSINLWAEIVDDYVRENIKGDVILMGNSLGSVVALSAASGDFTSGDNYIGSNGLAKGLCLFNCGIGMNSQGVVDEFDGIAKFFIQALFDFFNLVLFGNKPLLTLILGEVVTRELLNNALTNLYLVSPDRVNDELVESFYLPAKDDGSVEALSQIYTNDPGKTPIQIVEDNAEIFSKIPIHCVWGDEDPVTPFAGPVGQYFYNRAETDKMISFDLISSGHVPFDDNPDVSNGSMLRWLETDEISDRNLSIFGKKLESLASE